MSDTQPSSSGVESIEQPDPFAAFFSYKGQVGRAQYAIGIVVALGMLVVAFGALATVMSPTGGSAPALAIPFLAGFFWLHSLVTIKRLRDAGYPAWHYLIYLIGPFVWLAATAEFIESIGVGIALGLLAFFIVPGLFPTRAPALA
jgi:uncharacterized membrane protein YhaH (DUF805 family)